MSGSFCCSPLPSSLLRLGGAVSQTIGRRGGRVDWTSRKPALTSTTSEIPAIVTDVHGLLSAVEEAAVSLPPKLIENARKQIDLLVNPSALANSG